MIEENQTNWGQSVTGVVFKEGKVLLARHTYGSGKGKLIIPGGYVNQGETPQAALVREFKEETNITVEPMDLIGVRFNMHDWYIAFRAKYISGKEQSDHDENSEVVWMEIQEALKREDVPNLTKALIKSAMKSEEGLCQAEYTSSEKYAPYSLYCL